MVVTVQRMDRQTQRSRLRKCGSRSANVIIDTYIVLRGRQNDVRTAMRERRREYEDERQQPGRLETEFQARL